MFKRCQTLSNIKFQSHTFHKHTPILFLHLTQLSYAFKHINRLTKLSEHNLQKNTKNWEFFKRLEFMYGTFENVLMQTHKNQFPVGFHVID